MSLGTLMFDWWYRASFTTWWQTYLKGEFVASDGAGNRYVERFAAAAGNGDPAVYERGHFGCNTMRFAAEHQHAPVPFPESPR